MNKHCSNSERKLQSVSNSNFCILCGCLVVLCLLWFVKPSQLSAAILENQDELTRGRLLLIGGGEIPPEVRDLFFKLAGGENARIVLVPTGSQDAESADFVEEFLEPWRQYSAQSILVLHARNRHQANDSQFLQPLKEATGVWISGGVQSRLADRYAGTEFEAELKRLLSRDGIIAGTSAGAAVMTHVMIADGLQRPVLAQGLDLLRDAVVDQHFSQRFRMPRLVAACRNYPNRFGVGIDEGTGLLVHGNAGQVLGKGRVRLIACSSNSTALSPPLLLRDYSSGENIDLKIWRDIVGRIALTEQETLARRRKGLVAQSRVAPALAYSLSIDYEHFDSPR